MSCQKLERGIKDSLFKYMETVYRSNVSEREMYTFSCWIICEIPPFLKFSYSRLIARAKGATIAMFQLGMMLILLPCYCPMHIGHHAIIGNNVSLILSTHDIILQSGLHIQPSKGFGN